MTAWDHVPTLGSPVPQAMIEAIHDAAPLTLPTGTWMPVDGVTVATGTTAVGETTVALSPTLVVPALTVAVSYHLAIVAGGGTGKVSLTVSHKPGAPNYAAAVEAAAGGSAAVHANALVDVNGGRVTYAVVFTSSPSSVTWSIQVAGFLRSA